ncbi:MAG: hypothetical protein LBT73_01710 [Tannerellaceae bacterium]|jgi:hypothetical protein|nr:hypothetical protein [Tannerellaceae bacterium]
MKSDRGTFVSIDNYNDEVIVLDDSTFTLPQSNEGDFIMLSDDTPLLSEADTLDVSSPDWNTGIDNDVLLII